MIWFTADSHFDHANIIKYCFRPFEDVKHMDEILIGNWNSVVKPMDTVYVLGDFAMGDPRPYLHRLRGNIYLIPGDHDQWNKWPEDQVLTKIYQRIYHDQRIVLCHYPMLMWPQSHYGSWLLHGHNHAGNLPFYPGKIMNVGADLNDFCPVSWPKVVEHMESLSPNWNLVSR